MSVSIPSNIKNYRETPTSGALWVAILGTAPSTFSDAPWDDFRWKIWAHSSGGMMVPRADLFIDQHPKHCFMEERKNRFSDYYQWLKDSRIPVLMQKKYREIPASIAFPIERMKAEFPDVHVGSQTAMLIWYAMSKGAQKIALYGVEYSHDELERADQRESTIQWIGIAKGAGVTVIIPRTCSLSNHGREDYAWQTHDTPEKYAAIKAKFAEAMTKARPTFDPSVPCDTKEAQDAAFKLACEKNPDFAKEVAKMRQSDPPMPPQLLQMENDHLRGELARVRAQTIAPFVQRDPIPFPPVETK